jgi:GNAT superfamily N-acetyltransferase
MIFRTASISDIKQMFEVRMSVKENVLLNTDLVTEEICAEYLTNRGKGWVSEINNHLVGFAIADLLDDNIWALFVRPEFERIGIGKRLHDTMLNWYFGQGKEKAWLSTSPNTRAESFYRKAGWKEVWINPNGEIRFEMIAEDWKNLHK